MFRGRGGLSNQSMPNVSGNMMGDPMGIVGMNVYSPGMMINPNPMGMGMGMPMGMNMMNHPMGGHYGGMQMHHNPHNIPHLNTSGLYMDPHDDSDLLNSPTGFMKKTAQILYQLPDMNVDKEDFSYGNSGSAASSSTNSGISSVGGAGGFNAAVSRDANGPPSSSAGFFGGSPVQNSLNPQGGLSMSGGSGKPDSGPSPGQSQLPSVTAAQHVPPLSLNTIASQNALLPPDFPHPSPAACGKRKHAELNVAQMLAGAGGSKSGVLRPTVTPVDTSFNKDSPFKFRGGPTSVNFSLPSKTGSNDSLEGEGRASKKSLSIINPEVTGLPGDGTLPANTRSMLPPGRPMTPLTPWDKELKDMENRNKQLQTSFPFPASGQVSTPGGLSVNPTAAGSSVSTLSSPSGLSAYLSTVLNPNLASVTSSANQIIPSTANPLETASVGQSNVYGTGMYSQAVLNTIASFAHSTQDAPVSAPSTATGGLTPFSPSSKSPSFYSPGATVNLTTNTRTMSMLVKSNSSTASAYRSQSHTFSYCVDEEELQLLYAILNIIITNNNNMDGVASLEQFLGSIGDGVNKVISSGDNNAAESKDESVSHSSVSNTGAILRHLLTAPNSPPQSTMVSQQSMGSTSAGLVLNSGKTKFVSRLLNKLFPEGVSLLHVVCSGMTYSSSLSEGIDRDDDDANKADGSAVSDARSTQEIVFGGDYIYSVVKVLLAYGASAHTLDHQFNTCLHVCAQAAGKQIHSFASQGVVPDSQSLQAQPNAQQSGYENTGRLLLSSGCPLNAVNVQGDTALHLATRHGDVKFIELLIGLGCNCHIRNKQAQSALDVACTAAPSKMSNASRLSVRQLMMTLEPRLRTLVLFHDDCLEHSARRATDWEGPDRLQHIMNKLTNTVQANSSAGVVSSSTVPLFADYEVDISNRFDKASVELLERVHSPAYIHLVDSLSRTLQQPTAGPNTTGSTTSNSQDGNNSANGNYFPPPDNLPFTPQIQRSLLKRPEHAVKKSENCDTSFSAGTLNAARRAAGAVAHAIDHILSGRNRNAFCVVRPPGHHAGYEGLLSGASSCGFCIFNR
jgi:hypothetical protein